MKHMTTWCHAQSTADSSPCEQLKLDALATVAPGRHGPRPCNKFTARVPSYSYLCIFYSTAPFGLVNRQMSIR